MWGLYLARFVVYAPRMGKPTKPARTKSVKGADKSKPKRAKRSVKRAKRSVKRAKRTKANEPKQDEPKDEPGWSIDVVGAAEHFVHLCLVDPEGTARKVGALAKEISKVSDRIKANPEAAGVSVMKFAMSKLAQKFSEEK